MTDKLYEIVDGVRREITGDALEQRRLDAAEAQLFQEWWTSTEYQRKRQELYPTIGDQLDMLWHAIDNGTLNKTSDFYTAIKAVKDEIPKSE